MKSRTTIGLLQTITLTLIFLFLVYQQAECIGFSLQPQTARLTTFGNQNTGSRNQSTQHKKPISGKECRNNTDCAGIANTICMMHHDDTKMRCLCGDKTSPQNGACHHSKQGLHLKCKVDEDCISHAECKAQTNSSTSSNIARRCECKEGFPEDDYECSSGILTTVPCIDAALLLLFYPVLQVMH